MQDRCSATPPSDTAVQARLDAIEAKIDRLLSFAEFLEDMAAGFSSGGAGKLLRVLTSGGKG